ncbi:MAG: T9SS type A sorting domain-containing protein [Bacteroidetes bacterium]|nr:MAG: T9SS type A sorting domain-containing protein [Bacteroidota bacterium]
MAYRKTLALCFVSCVLIFQSSSAQSFTPDVIGSAGAFATSSSGSMSWTIGEVMTETYSSSGNFFTQGFHQPDTATLTVVSNTASENIAIYPNPVADYLIIDLSLTAGEYILEIFDMQGQRIRKEIILSGQKQVLLPFREFANGIYLLNLINKESQTRTSYKINKAE